MPEPILAEADMQFYAHPRCSVCGVAMWLVKVSPIADLEEQLNFECKACGEMTIVECRLR